jgi:hypothetical protein
VKVCPKCGGTEFVKRPDAVVRSQGRCRNCQREASRIYRRRNPNKIRLSRYDITRMDRMPNNCMHQMFGASPCRFKAKWRNGEWRACDKHKLPGDEPIAVDRKHARLPPP